jgi:hypothetical protein
MKRVAIAAALLFALPALAQDYPGDDDAWQQDNPAPPPQGAEGWGQPQYGQPPGQPPSQEPPPMPGEPYGETEQAAPQESAFQPPDQGPTYTDFENDPSLSSAGVWFDSPQYGRIWRPTQVQMNWQPYLYGRWAYTAAGWAWVSDEPFGWATYHYGRWAVLDDGGWAWLPGRVWGPAWVAWRYDAGYAAWCPLGPRSIVYDQPRLWVAVDTRHFLDPVHTYVVPVTRRREIVVRAQLYRGPRQGPPAVLIGRSTGRTIRPLVITDGGSRRSEVRGGSVQFYRPRTAPVVVNRAPGIQRGVVNRTPLVQRPGLQPQRPVVNRERPVLQQQRPVVQQQRPVLQQQRPVVQQQRSGTQPQRTVQPTPQQQRAQPQQRRTVQQKRQEEKPRSEDKR